MKEDIMEDQGKVKAVQEGAPTIEMTKQDKAYISGLIKMIHSPKTSGDIVAMLKAAPPEQSVPQTALTLNGNLAGMSKEKGKAVPFETSMKGIVMVSQELFLVGQEAGIFEVQQEEGAAIIQDTLSKYVHAGLKDKSIDPIEIQQYGESLMTPEQKEQALAVGAQNGVPAEPGVSQAMETYAGQREQGVLNKMSNQQAGQNRQGMMQNVQQGAPQGQLQEQQGGA